MVHLCEGTDLLIFNYYYRYRIQLSGEIENPCHVWDNLY